MFHSGKKIELKIITSNIKKKTINKLQSFNLNNG